MSAERGTKRVRQACEPCRRKKSRCPGEKPVCSHCGRLGQSCFYANEVHHSGRSFADSQSSPRAEMHQGQSDDRRLEKRLNFMEAKLAQVLATQESQSQGPSRQASDSPLPPVQSTIRSKRTSIVSNGTLPSWELIVSIAELYLLYCDCQPLPLFHRDTFIPTIADRHPEVIFAILALTVRFSDDALVRENQMELANRYVDESRTMIMKRIADGEVELSTLQALCLVSLVDFTNGNTRRASVHSSLAMSLAHNAGLTSEIVAPASRIVREERRRCFWSLFLLKRLHGADFSVLNVNEDDTFPWYPETTGKLATPGQSQQDLNSAPLGSCPPQDDIRDKGVVAYAIQLSEVWFKITRYARRRGKPSSLPPWSPQSEYSTILAQQMDFETRMPYVHRFRPAEFSKKSTVELNANRGYWGPWLFIQVLYHTNLCLLNHPLLLSLRLRNFKCVIPEIFLQNTSDLISSHASWIIHLISMLEAKSFKVTDPFLAHCVAIVATIYLQESFVEDAVVRQEKQDMFAKCLNFVRGFGEQWPHVARMAEKLERLGETVSSTYLRSTSPLQTPNRSLLIDLGRFWEILEYSSSSELPDSAHQLFGSSLYSGLQQSTTEMTHASSLPEPTRVDTQDFSGSESNAMNSIIGQQVADSMATAPPFIYSDDELAVLAESFFQQRPEFDANVADWWSTGNL